MTRRWMGLQDEKDDLYRKQQLESMMMRSDLPIYNVHRRIQTAMDTRDFQPCSIGMGKYYIYS
jgi:hypothetical protein